MPTPHELEVAKRQDVLRRHGNDFYVQAVSYTHLTLPTICSV